MSRLTWRTTKTFRWKEFEFPCAESLAPQTDATAGLAQLAGVRPTGFGWKKRLGWPANELLRHAIGSGYIERGVGRFIRKYATREIDFLEFGCGPMNCRRYLPRGQWYNAIDIAFSEFQLRRVLRPGRLINLAIGSAADIPLADDGVSMLVSVEVLYCIPDVDRVFAECRRVLRDGGTMICSVGNAFYTKYQRVGPHPDVRNRWTFQGFIDHVARFGFELLEADRRGLWIPSERHKEFWLPISPKDESETATFTYAFRLRK